MITQLGQDPFSDKIVGELQAVGVDTSLIARTAQANTSGWPLSPSSRTATVSSAFSAIRAPIC